MQLLWAWRVCQLLFRQGQDGCCFDCSMPRLPCCLLDVAIDCPSWSRKIIETTLWLDIACIYKLSCFCKSNQHNELFCNWGPSILLQEDPRIDKYIVWKYVDCLQQFIYSNGPDVLRWSYSQLKVSIEAFFCLTTWLTVWAANYLFMNHPLQIEVSVVIWLTNDIMTLTVDNMKHDSRQSALATSLNCQRLKIRPNPTMPSERCSSMLTLKQKKELLKHKLEVAKTVIQLYRKRRYNMDGLNARRLALLRTVT